MEKEPLFSAKNALSLLSALAMAIAAIVLFRSLPFLHNIGYFEIFIVSLLSSATIFIPLPGFAIVLGASAYLNPVLLGIAAGLGSGIGEISGYLAGFAGSGAVSRFRSFVSHKAQIEKYGAFAIFVLAFIPNPAFDLAGIAAGAIRMRWWEFLLASCSGKILRYILLAHFGIWTSSLFF
ncbi:MAG: VTT domain-containing protein [Candidatus Micrarchaeota archaeon]|nr:VTT domain-containing protein [Candidatus Micrarchaeota archaeon]